VFDAVGSQLAACIDSARRGGRIILFGSNSNAKPPIQQYWITRHELTVCGSYISRHTYPQVVKLLESGRLPLPQLITHDFGLSRIGEGLAALQTGDAIEVILRPE
jgi:threonine dehydrogenase-like Zn-dependent dehydrogenase